MSRYFRAFYNNVVLYAFIPITNRKSAHMLAHSPDTFIATFVQNAAMNKCYRFGTGKSGCPSLAHFPFTIGISSLKLCQYFNYFNSLTRF